MGVPVVESFEYYICSGSTTTLVLDKPSGVETGDLLVLLLMGEDATDTTTFEAVTGWTKEFENPGSVPDCQTGIYWRIADGTEGTTVTVTIGTGNDVFVGYYLRISGVDQDDPIHVMGSGDEENDVSSHDISAITTTENDCLAIALFAYDGGDGEPFTVGGTGWPTSFPTDQIQEKYASTGVTGAWVSKSMASSGSTSDCEVGSNLADGFASNHFAILGASAGAYELSCEAGAFVEAGTAADLLYSGADTSLSCEGGTFLHTGTDAKFPRLIWDSSTFYNDSWIWLPGDYDVNRAKKYPVLIFYHGTGANNDTPEELKSTDAPTPLSEIINRNWDFDYDFIFINPSQSFNWVGSSIYRSTEDEDLDVYNIDRNKIFVTGLSMGGIIISQHIDLPPTSGNFIDKIRGAYPVSGSNEVWDEIEAQDVIDRNLILRGWWGENDPNAWVVPRMQDNADDVNAIVPDYYDVNPVPGAGHSSSAWGVPYQDYDEGGIYWDVNQAEDNYLINTISEDYAVEGTDAIIKIDRKLSCEAGAFVESGTDATLDWSGDGGSVSIIAEAGAFVEAGTNADLLWGRAIDAEAGAFVEAGTNASLEKGYKFSCESGAFIEAGTNADLLRDSVLSIGLGEYLLSGQIALLEMGWAIDLGLGEYLMAGQSIELTWSGGSVSMTADSGTFTEAGGDVGLIHDKSITLESGAFLEAGSDVDLEYGLSIEMDAGAFVLSGQAIALPRTYKLSAEVGAFIEAGTDASLEKGYRLSIGAGGVVSAGQDVEFTWEQTEYILSAEAGSFLLIGKDVEFKRTLVIQIGNGAYLLVGKDIDLSTFNNALREIIEEDSYITTELSEDSYITTELSEDSYITTVLNKNSKIK